MRVSAPSESCSLARMVMPVDGAMLATAGAVRNNRRGRRKRGKGIATAQESGAGRALRIERDFAPFNITTMEEALHDMPLRRHFAGPIKGHALLAGTSE